MASVNLVMALGCLGIVLTSWLPHGGQDGPETEGHSAEAGRSRATVDHFGGSMGIDGVADKLAGAGIARLVPLAVMATTGLTGAAAMTAAHP